MKVRKGFGIVCLILIALVSLNGIAFSECAWVLWLHRQILNIRTPSETNEWEILIALPKYEQCLKSQKTAWSSSKTRWMKQKEQGSTITKIDSGESSMVSVTVGDSTITETFICLPSPLDPRGR